MALDPDVREAFFVSAGDFELLVGGIDSRRLDDPATGSWSVLELVAHASRAFTATMTVLSMPVDAAAPHLDSAGAYFRAAFAVPGIHEGIDQRAREASGAFRVHPARTVHEAIAEVRPLVEATDLATEVQHFAGRLEFGDYLVTRVAELVLHSADLQYALDLPITSSPQSARIVRDLVVELSDRVGDLAVACVLTGRPWAPGCNVLA